MNTKRKNAKPILLSTLLAVMFSACGCEHKNTTEPNDDITWQQTALDSIAIRALATNIHGDVFAASSPCPGADIYLSSDRGNSWSSLRPNSCVNYLATNSMGHIFASEHNFLLRSTDGGGSWVSLSLPFGPLMIRPIVFNAAGDLFIGSIRSDETLGGVYRSSDNGETWIQTGLPDSLFGPTGGANVLAINSIGHIFAGTGFGVYRSLDNGDTWTQMNNGFQGLAGGPIVEALAINPVNGDIFCAILVDGVYRSTNNGDTWTLTDLTNPNISSLVINTNGEIFAASYSFNPQQPSEGVFYSNDHGSSWSRINDGLSDFNVLTLAIDFEGYLYAGSFSFPGPGSGVFRTVKSTIE